MFKEQKLQAYMIPNTTHLNYRKQANLEKIHIPSEITT